MLCSTRRATRRTAEPTLRPAATRSAHDVNRARPAFQGRALTGTTCEKTSCASPSSHRVPSTRSPTSPGAIQSIVRPRPSLARGASRNQNFGHSPEKTPRSSLSALSLSARDSERGAALDRVAPAHFAPQSSSTLQSKTLTPTTRPRPENSREIPAHSPHPHGPRGARPERESLRKNLVESRGVGRSFGELP